MISIRLSSCTTVPGHQPASDVGQDGLLPPPPGLPALEVLLLRPRSGDCGGAGGGGAGEKEGLRAAVAQGVWSG